MSIEVNTLINKVNFEKLELEVVSEFLSVFDFVSLGEVKDWVVSLGGGGSVLESVEIEVEKRLHGSWVEGGIISFETSASSYGNLKDFFQERGVFDSVISLLTFHK